MVPFARRLYTSIDPTVQRAHHPGVALGYLVHMFGRKSIRVPWLRVTAGCMQVESMGRLPSDVAAGGAEQQPTPQYISEAVSPSEEAWAREQTRYHAKEDSERSA